MIKDNLQLSKRVSPLILGPPLMSDTFLGSNQPNICIAAVQAGTGKGWLAPYNIL